MHRALLMPGPKFHKSCEIGCQANSTRPRMPDSESIDVFCFARVSTIHAPRTQWQSFISEQIGHQEKSIRHGMHNYLLQNTAALIWRRKNPSDWAQIDAFCLAWVSSTSLIHFLELWQSCQILWDLLPRKRRQSDAGCAIIRQCYTALISKKASSRKMAADSFSLSEF